MHSIVVSQNGGSELLALSDSPEPTCGADEIRVDVAAAGVNFIDIYQREGLYSIPLPYTPGLEGAGIVSAVGSQVTRFQPGDRVAWCGHLGSYAQQVSLRADTAVHVPSTLSLESAAGMTLQGLTAHYLVTSVYDVKAGDWALVHAAAGGVGLLLCQMISARGATVIGTVSTEAKADAAKRAGASHVIRYDTEDVPTRVRELTEGRGVNVVYDGVGQATFQGSLRSLSPRGTLALFGQASGPVTAFDPQILNQLGSLVLTRPSLTHFTATPEELQWRAGEVLGAVASGELAFTLSGTYPLEDAARAHDDLGSRKTSGKLLLIP